MKETLTLTQLEKNLVQSKQRQKELQAELDKIKIQLRVEEEDIIWAEIKIKMLSPPKVS